MLVFFTTVLIAYLAIWAILLGCCIRRKQFYPVLSNSRRTRILWLLTFGLLNPLLTLFYLVFGQFRSPQARPWRFVIVLVVLVVISGFFVNIPGLTHLWMQPFVGRSADPDPKLKAHLGAIRSTNNASTTSSVASSDNSRLACRKVAVIVEGEHLLLLRIGQALNDALKNAPHVESVALLVDGAFPSDGQRAPDIFVRLRLDSIKENMLPYTLKLQAGVHAFVGREPWSSRSSNINSRTPPVLNFNLQIDLEHTSRTTGYESHRYTLAGRNIAEQLSEALIKSLKGWQDKHGLLPDIPEGFYGDYTPTELPEPLMKLNPQIVCSYSGLMKHSDTFHRLAIRPDRIDTLSESVDQMKSLGWRTGDNDFDKESINVRLNKDDRLIQIFTPRRERARRRAVVMIGPRPTDSETVLYVRDVRLLSGDELGSVLDTLLAEPMQLELLLMFERMFEKAQRDKFYDLLREHRPSNVHLQLRLAEMYEQKGEIEESKKALLRASTLLWSIRDETNVKSRLKKLAKKLGDEELAKKPASEAAFRDAGFIDASETAVPIERKVGLDSPVVLFYRDSNDKLRAVSLTISRSGSETDPFILKHVERTAYGASWGSRGGWQQTGNIWKTTYSHQLGDSRLNCQISSLEDGANFKMSFNIK